MLTTPAGGGLRPGPQPGSVPRQGRPCTPGPTASPRAHKLRGWARGPSGGSRDWTSCVLRTPMAVALKRPTFPAGPPRPVAPVTGSDPPIPHTRPHPPGLPAPSQGLWLKCKCCSGPFAGPAPLGLLCRTRGPVLVWPAPPHVGSRGPGASDPLPRKLTLCNAPVSSS